MKPHVVLIPEITSRVKISRIVDCSKESTYSYRETPVRPFIVLFSISGYEFDLMKEDCRDYTKSFATASEAYYAAVKFVIDFKYDAAIVTKNADFTEGRGPMVFHRLFESVKNAEEYVSRQNGIYGSKQYREIHFGINIHGMAYAHTYWNGYEIQLVSFED